MAELDAAPGRRRPEAVAAPKQQDGADLHAIGSTDLVHMLIEHGLVDELRLMIVPLYPGPSRQEVVNESRRTAQSLF